MNAKVRDEAVPAIYGDEESTIPVFRTSLRALSVVWKGFWKRIYYKYILVNFHPIALFLILSLFLSLIGIGFALFIVIDRIVNDASPTTGSVMLAVLPLILGFQLFLTSITMDMNNESK
jgi:hypothetical protein